MSENKSKVNQVLWPKTNIRQYIKVINQLREGQNLQHEMWSILDSSASELAHEADLASDIWVKYTERKASRRREGFRIIMDLASQIDQLKVDLDTEKRLFTDFKVTTKIYNVRYKTVFRRNQHQ